MPARAFDAVKLQNDNVYKANIRLKISRQFSQHDDQPQIE